MKEITSNVGPISFKFNGSITVELEDSPVVVEDSVAEVMESRLGKNITVNNSKETVSDHAKTDMNTTEEVVEEVLPEVAEVETEATEPSFASESNTTEEVVETPSEEVTEEETVVAPKKGRGSKNK